MHPAVLKSAAPPAVLENEEPPAVSDTTSPPEVLDEPLAAELAGYLKDFPPYARPAQDPALNVGGDPKGGASQSESPPAFRETAPAAPAVTNESETSILIPGNLKLETVFPPETEKGKSKPRNRLFLPEPPEGVDFCAAKAAELFLMTHGYPRDNPPKHIPVRRRDEDTRGFRLFREIKKFF